MEPGCYSSKVRVRIPQGLLVSAAPVVGTLPGAVIKTGSSLLNNISAANAAFKKLA